MWSISLLRMIPQAPEHYINEEYRNRFETESKIRQSLSEQNF